MDSHHAVVDLAPVAVPLPRDAHRSVSAFADGGLVHHANRLGVRVLGRNDPLTLVVEFFLIPLARFQETLYSAGCLAELQGDSFGRLAMDRGQLPLEVNPHQFPGLPSPETTGKQSQKRDELPAQPGNL